MRTMRWLRLPVGVALWCALGAPGGAVDADPGAPPEVSEGGATPDASHENPAPDLESLDSESLDRASERPLHELVDDLVARRAHVVHGCLAEDAEFFRRLSLDLLGMSPTADDVRAFLSDPRPNKR